MTSLALTDADIAGTEDDNDPAKALELPASQRDRINKSRVLANGLPKIREQADTYLPKLEGEGPERYKRRVQMGALHPAHEEMKEGIIGTLCATPITFEKDMPPEGVALWENIDGRGTGGQKYTSTLLGASIIDGMAGTFVDAPNADDPSIDRSGLSAAAVPGAPLDAADGERLGLEPYCVQCRMGEFYAGYSTINGKQVCTLFIRRERLRTTVGNFGRRVVVQYRVYRQKGRVVTRELWREPAPGVRAELVPNSLTTLRNCNRICWTPFESGIELEDGTLKPMLEQLGDLVLQYYQIQNGMMSLSFEAFVATIVRVGAIPEVTHNSDGTKTITWPTLLTGSEEVIEMPPSVDGVALPDKPVYFLQPNSDVLEPAGDMLEKIDALIDRITSALQGKDVANESGEAKKQKSRGGNARMTKLAVALKEHLERVFQDLMMFKGKKAGGVNVKTSFEDISLSAQDLTAITSLVKEGMDVEDAVDVLINRGFFGPHADAKAIAERWRDNRAAMSEIEKMEEEWRKQEAGDDPADDKDDDEDDDE